MARRAAPDNHPETPQLGTGEELPFTRLADLLLQREALLVRLARGAPPDDLAGLRIDDERIDRLLLEITGLSEETAAEVADVRSRLADVLDAERERFSASLAAPHPFSIMAANADVDQTGAEVLALLCAVEIDARRQHIVAYIQDDVTRRRLTLGGLRRVMASAGAPAGVLAVAPDAALQRACLVDVETTGPWAIREVSLAAPATWALLGDGSTDPDLPPDVEVRPFEVEAVGDGLALVVGPDRTRRVQQGAAALVGDRFLVTPPPGSEAGWRAIIREATLQGVGIIVDADTDLPADTRQWIERARHLPWALCTPLEQPLEALPRAGWVELEAEPTPPTDAEWTAALDGAARTHNLTARQLELVGRAYGPKGGDLDAAVRRLASGRIDQLTRRVRPSRTWDDIVVTPERLDQLHELVTRYRHRGTVYDDWGFRADKSTGIIGLFHGPSGTGKTLAAEIIAGDLGLDLFKLDLAAVVSKYIGETEKNLEEIFDAAAAASGVLLFDEADSLFGKRGEVTDARDRYANMEVSYLLQRVEAYEGIIILTTNFQKNIDSAFLRRIHVSLEFPMPEPDQRLALWRSGFPETAPVGDIDFDFLAAQFKLAGGSIHNVTVYAGFLAAAGGDPTITMEHVVRALKREYQKLGRLRTRDEFGPYADLVAD